MFRLSQSIWLPVQQTTSAHGREPGAFYAENAAETTVQDHVLAKKSAQASRNKPAAQNQQRYFGLGEGKRVGVAGDWPCR